MKAKHSYRFSVIAVWTFLLSAPAVLVAQTPGTATISGAISDSTGAVVPGASVELRDISTDISRSRETNTVGQYIFENVLPGTYKLTVRMQAFQQLVIPSIKIDVARTYRVDGTLQVGTVAEVVEVTPGVEVELQTATATVGNVLEHESLLRLPNVNRNTTTYLFLQAGAMPPPGERSGETDPNRYGQVAGMRSDQANFLLDGVDVSDRRQGFTGTGEGNFRILPIIPIPAESVEEFRVGISNPIAGYSLSAGAQVTMVTRRGTNSLHGSGYWYHQNDNLNANTWTRNRLGQRNPELKDNRLGSSLGGPIWKNRSFVYGHYEGRRFPRSQDVLRLVPTDSLRRGTLRFRDAAGNVVGYDLVASALCGPANTDRCDPRGIGLNPVVNSVWQLLPPGNDPSSGDGLNTIGFRSVADGSTRSDFSVLRLDHNFTDRWRFAGTFRYGRSEATSPAQLDIGGLLAGHTRGQAASTGAELIHQRLVSANLTHDITSRLTSNFRFGWYRDYQSRRREAPFPQVAATNIALQIAGGAAGAGILDQPVDVDAGTARSTTATQKSLQFFEDLTWVKGRHAMNFGGSVHRGTTLEANTDRASLGLVTPVAVIDSGSFTPVAATQRPPTCGGSVTTNCLRSADVNRWDRLYNSTLGIINSISFTATRNGNFQPLAAGTPVIVNGKSYFPQFYFNDTWRFRPSLTLGAGLTYEWQTPPVENDDRLSLLINKQTGGTITASSYLNARRAAAERGEIFNPQIALQPVRGAGRRSLRDTDWHNFGPRASLAWSPAFQNGFPGKLFGNRATVIRGGYSLVYSRFNWTSLSIFSLFSIFAQTASLNGPRNASGQPLRIGVDGSAPLPTVPTVTPPVAPSAPFGDILTISDDPNNRTPRAHNLTVTVQRELPGHMLLEFGWLGNFGRNLTQDVSLQSAPLFMIDPGSRQTFAQAFDAVARQLRAGVPVAALAAQPWFENELPALARTDAVLRQRLGGNCGSAANLTQCLALNFGSAFQNGQVSNLWISGIDSIRLFSDQIFGTNFGTVHNLQLLDSGARLGDARSNFHAFILTLRKRMSHGLLFDLNYTLSKSLDNNGRNQNSAGAVNSAYNLDLDYGPAIFDRRHVLNAHWYYELPLGPGRALSFGNWGDKVIGGWYTAGIFTANSGLPLCPSQGGQAFGGGLLLSATACAIPLSGGDFGNSAHSGVAGTGGVGTAGNPAIGGTGLNLFGDPAAVFNNYRRILVTQDGRAPRGTLRGMPRWNLDLSLGKKTALAEKVQAVFSCDFLNVFNHVDFNDPTLSLSALASFGVITSQLNSPRAIQLGLRVEF